MIACLVHGARHLGCWQVLGSLVVGSTFLASGALADALVDRVAELRGTVARDAEGNVVEVNLENCSATQADIALLAGHEHVRKLHLWGADVTDEAIDVVVTLPRLA
ncbi:MAG TPA: hypothetical protein PKC18_05090, partial [Lacipirellulaceae bacterium]|nr:hypothetical protein [Lacipirellulaceae bacterium]